MKKFLALLTCGFLTLAFLSCESAKPKQTAGPAAAKLSSMNIIPDRASVDVGSDLELIATGIDSGGAKVAVSPVWKQISGTAYGTLQTPQAAGDRAIISGKKAGYVKVEIRSGDIVATSVIEIRNVSRARASRSFK
jgi:hypothetical protein